MEPITVKDGDGYVIMAAVKTYGDTSHTFVQRDEYKGIFLPEFKKHPNTEVINKLIEQPVFIAIDHCVGNQGDGEMEPAVKWYE